MNFGSRSSWVAILLAATFLQGAWLPALAAKPADASVAAASNETLQQDPAIRSGRLSNGLRYFITKTTTPPGAVSFRMRIGAGSLNEADAERGLAHLLEHLVMAGTRNFPDGSMVKQLEAAGLKLGPDTNAVTEFNQTIYKIDAPKADPATVELALKALADMAMNADITPAILAQQQAVVLAEERSRANPQLLFGEAALKFLFAGDLIGKRLPIGTPETVSAIDIEAANAFYKRTYRPELATLVVAGDVDPALLERDIKARFAGWVPAGPATATLPAFIGKNPTDKVSAGLFENPQMQPLVSVSWTTPIDGRPDTRAKRIDSIRDQLALQAFAQRLGRRSRTDKPPFPSAFANRSQPGQRARTVELGALVAGEQWPVALAALDEELRQALDGGFAQAEIDEVGTNARAQMQAAVVADPSTPAPTKADVITFLAGNDQTAIPVTAAQNIMNEALAGFDAAAASARLHTLFGPGAPRIFMSTPAALAGGDAAIESEWNKLATRKIAAREKVTTIVWPYTSFGTPGVPGPIKAIEQLTATMVSFPNGVRLAVKPTKFKPGEIQIGVKFGQGTRGLDPKNTVPGFLWSIGGLQEAGLGKLDAQQLQTALAGKLVALRPGIDDEAFMLNAATRPEDLETQLQLLAAQLSDPGWRPGVIGRLQQLVPAMLANANASPQGVFQLQSDTLLRSGDQRTAFPAIEKVQTTTMEDIRNALKPEMTRTPISVVIVGDVTVPRAIELVAKTLGAVPTASPAGAAAPLRAFPKAGSATLYHNGRADQALAFTAWPTQGFYRDTRITRALSLLSDVIQLRLNDRVRTSEGLAYSPRSGRAASEEDASYGYLSVSAEVEPSKIETFRQDVDAIVRDLKAKPVTAEELERARKPLLERLLAARSSDNAYLKTRLFEVLATPDSAADFAAAPAMVKSFTADELQKVAQVFLVNDKRWDLKIVPRP